MATFDRFDICLAHWCLENDWNKGGWLQERPSNQRRMEATHVQLYRMHFRASPCGPSSFGGLVRADEYENAADIYVEKLVSFGLAKLVDPNDELGEYIRSKFAPEYVNEHFPQLTT